MMRQAAVKRIFIDHIELWLSAAGLVVIWAIPLLFTPSEEDWWRVTALTAIAVGLIHGVVFWVVRRWRQKVRAQAQALIEEENTHLEERVSERTEQLRGLASELALAEQRERHRLAVALHDHVQQLLFSVQMQVQYLVKNCSREGAVPEVGIVNASLGKAIASTRNLSLELSPPVLAGEGLDQALQWLAFYMKDSYRLDVDFESRTTSADVDEAIRVLLFQVVRELLADAAEKAHEHPVLVTLEDGANEVVIGIQGLDMQLNGSTTTGEDKARLERLRERLYFLGGSIDELPPAGQGPKVTITAPKTMQPRDSVRHGDDA